jgi:transposase
MLAQDGSHFRSFAKRATLHRADEEGAFGQVTLGPRGFRRQGLFPAQNSIGDRAVLLGISKCGDRYLRTLVIHGARIALHHSSRKIDPTSRWVNTIK